MERYDKLAALTGAAFIDMANLSLPVWSYLKLLTTGEVNEQPTLPFRPCLH